MSECTFIIRGQGDAGHRLQAVGAGHHQWVGAPLRLGGAGQGPRSEAADSPGLVEDGYQKEAKRSPAGDCHKLILFFPYLAIRAVCFCSMLPSAGAGE